MHTDIVPAGRMPLPARTFTVEIDCHGARTSRRIEIRTTTIQEAVRIAFEMMDRLPPRRLVAMDSRPGPDLVARLVAALRKDAPAC